MATKGAARSIHVVLGEPDTDALYWAWRRELVTHPDITPSLFADWVARILAEQAHAIRAGLGPHTALAATWRLYREQAAAKPTQKLYIPRNLGREY